MFNSALVYELACLKLYAEPLLFSIGKKEPEYVEAKRLLKFFDYFVAVPSEEVPHNSILREFVGGSCFDVCYARTVTERIFIKREISSLLKNKSMLE